MSKVGGLLEDLETKLKTVPSLNGNVHIIHDPADLRGMVKSKGMPLVGIVYLTSRGKEDGSKSGLAAEAVFDLILVGANKCKNPGDDTLLHVADVLESMRDSIKLTCTTVPQHARKWQFALETIADVGCDDLSYLQRWKTTLLFT